MCTAEAARFVPGARHTVADMERDDGLYDGDEAKVKDR